MDWRSWHDEYDRPGSHLANRLQVVRERIRLVLDEAPPGPVKLISLCAGQGRDLLPVLKEHPRRDDVLARLVELDPHNADAARAEAAAARLDRVEVVADDAALVDHYQGMAPADIVLACGVFGNITDDDIRRTVGFLPQLCAGGATVIWTRHRGAPDRVPVICDWLEEEGFARVWVSDARETFGVGVHRFTGRPAALTLGRRMFHFVGREKLYGPFPEEA